MLQVLMTNEYGPNYSEHLLAAFRTLDPQNLGYIPIDVMENLMTTKGIPLREREIDSFISHAGDKTGKVIYYEDYVNRTTEDLERHRETLTKDYDAFKVPGINI